MTAPLSSVLSALLGHPIETVVAGIAVEVSRPTVADAIAFAALLDSGLDPRLVSAQLVQRHCRVVDSPDLLRQLSPEALPASLVAALYSVVDGLYSEFSAGK